MTTTPSKPAGIDPRGPRFGAAITAVLLLATLFVALVQPWLYAAPLLAVIVALFAWGRSRGFSATRTANCLHGSFNPAWHRQPSLKTRAHRRLPNSSASSSPASACSSA